LCSSGGSGTFDISIDVDFANRTIGGGTSSLGLLPGGTLSSNPYTYISATSFDSQSGSTPLPLNVSDSEFSGTTAVFMNSGGVVAKDLAVSIQYLSTLTTDHATGTAVGAVPGR
jgi:hypothetical protein